MKLTKQLRQLLQDTSILGFQFAGSHIKLASIADPMLFVLKILLLLINWE